MSIVINNKDIKSMTHNNIPVMEWRHNDIVVYGGKTVVTMNSGSIRPYPAYSAYCYSTIKEIDGPAFTQYDENTVQCAIDMNITVSMSGSMSGQNRDYSSSGEVGIYNITTKEYIKIAGKSFNGIWGTGSFSGTKSFSVKFGDILKPYAYMSLSHSMDYFLKLNTCTITYEPDDPDNH